MKKIKSIVFLLSFVVGISGCSKYTQKQYDEGVDQAYNNGESDGRAKGFQEGYDQGKQEGYAQGYSKGLLDGGNLDYNDGYANGLADGEQAGYNRGKADGERVGYDKGYDDGYVDGDEDGFQDGYDQGLVDGFNAGYSDGYDEGVLVSYDVGYDDGLDDGYDQGLDDGYDDGYGDGYIDGDADGYAAGEADGYDIGFDDGHDEGYLDGYDVGFDDGWFAAGGSSAGVKSNAQLLTSNLLNDLIDFKKIKSPKQVLTDPANKKLLLSSTAGMTVDTKKKKAVLNKYIVGAMKNQLISKYGLNESRSHKLAKLANQMIKASNTGEISMSTVNTFSAKALGSDITSMQDAFKKSIQGDPSSLNAVVSKAAELNEVTPAHAQKIMIQLLQ